MNNLNQTNSSPYFSIPPITNSVPGLIFKKMNDVMKEIGAIGKNQKNQAQGFKFRGIDDMLNNLYPALCRHGVFMTTTVLTEQHELRDVTRGNGKQGVDKHVSVKMMYTFHAEDGSSVSSSVPAEGLDSGDKATNKALSAALKYALIQTFSIPTEDMEEGDLTTPVIARNVKSDVKVDTNQAIPCPGPSLAAPAVPESINPAQTEVPKRSTFRKPSKKTEPVAPKDDSENGWEN